MRRGAQAGHLRARGARAGLRAARHAAPRGAAAAGAAPAPAAGRRRTLTCDLPQVQLAVQGA